MASEKPTSSGPDTRTLNKRWLENWRIAGPILEAERWARVEALTDEETQVAVQRLLELWQPDWPTDDGEGLLLQQRVFARARTPK